MEQETAGGGRGVASKFLIVDLDADYMSIFNS